MVGDSLRADVAGAKALGMTAVLKRNKVAEKDPEKDMGRSERKSRGDSAEPDFVVDEISDLVTLPIFAAK
jgi:FMN phosphatase YigB (HAD superfamily)